jgi:hypothetical protein
MQGATGPRAAGIGSMHSGSMHSASFRECTPRKLWLRPEQRRQGKAFGVSSHGVSSHGVSSARRGWPPLEHAAAAPTPFELRWPSDLTARFGSTQVC